MAVRPTTRVPSLTWDNLYFTRNKIELSEEETATSTVLAWLIPDGSLLYRHILVRVPVHTGVLRPTSVDQLDTEIWFDAGRGIASPTSDLTGRTFEVERFPDNAPQDLEHSFTFVVAPQHSRGPNVHAVNQTILQFAPDLSPPVRGNVLVFRHGGPPRKYLADMEEQYWIAVTHIASVVFRDLAT